VLLRSRLLLPASPAAAIKAEQDAAAALRRLEEMILVRAAGSWLTARRQLGIEVFARPAATAPSREGGYVALMEACLVVLRGISGLITGTLPGRSGQILQALARSTKACASSESSPSGLRHSWSFVRAAPHPRSGRSGFGGERPGWVETRRSASGRRERLPDIRTRHLHRLDD
jgi:hypothetical protein